jgi:hypothetical protein
MICWAGKLARFLKAYRVYLGLAFVGALGKANLGAVCGRVVHARLGKTPSLLQEKQIA